MGNEMVYCPVQDDDVPAYYCFPAHFDCVYCLNESLRIFGSFTKVDDGNVYCPVLDEVTSVCNCAGEDFNCQGCALASVAE